MASSGTLEDIYIDVEPSSQELVSVFNVVPPMGVPKDIAPLRSLPAESSGAPSTSQPTNILPRNPSSWMTEMSLRQMKIHYRFPCSIEVRLASSSERIDFVVPGWIGLYERPFVEGLRFPLPRLVC